MIYFQAKHFYFPFLDRHSLLHCRDFFKIMKYTFLGGRTTFQSELSDKRCELWLRKCWHRRQHRRRQGRKLGRRERQRRHTRQRNPSAGLRTWLRGMLSTFLGWVKLSIVDYCADVVKRSQVGLHIIYLTKNTFAKLCKNSCVGKCLFFTNTFS